MREGGVASDEDWNEQSFEYTMHPSGELVGDDIAGLFLSRYSFDVLPPESLAPGDSWSRVHGLSSSRGGTLHGKERGRGLGWSRDNGSVVTMAFGLVEQEDGLGVSFTSACSLPPGTDFDELRLRQVALAGAGEAVFDTVDRCTDRSEYVSVPGDAALRGIGDMTAYARAKLDALERARTRLAGRPVDSGRVLHLLLERQRDGEGGGDE